MDDSISFGAWVKQRRKALDITQEDLAERVGCSGAAIRKIEAGERRPSRQVAQLLADHLQIASDERAAFLALARGQQAAPSQPVVAPNNLPAPLTRLIGRDDILKAVTDHVRGPTRLLTLTGAPGIGKTRLSLEVAAELLDSFEDGVFFVPLASITESDFVPSTIAKTLGLQESSSPLLNDLIRYLRSKRTLLVLDNFEQVVEAAGVLAELLVNCPDLKALITSREALRVSGERQFPVPPLALPDPTRLPSLEDLGTYPAVALFVERAQSADPNFDLTQKNAEAIASICMRLDGLPLAIELAAAHISSLTPQEILTRLDTRLKLLTVGARDLPPRQQTLRNAIDWSYNLLDPPEQTLLARLGVFLGGWTLSAAEAVCNPAGDLAEEVLVGLESLLDQSLLVQGEGMGGDSRYTMLEMIREYAMERLDESGEAETIRRLHAEFYLALAEGGEPMLQSPEQSVWLGQLEAEHGNLRAALSWFLERGEIELAVRLASTLFRFWSLRGHFNEARRWIDAILEKSNRAPSALLLAVRISSANIELGGEDPERVQPLFEESLKLYRELGDKRGILFTLSNLGGLAQSRGDAGQARAHYEEALALAESLGDKWFAADSLSGLGWVAHDLGDYAKATALFERGVALDRERGDTHDIAARLTHLGTVAVDAGDYARARSVLEKSLATQRQLGDRNCSARSLRALGVVALAQGDYVRARTLLEESISLSQEVGNKKNIAYCLEAFAELASVHGQATRAARLAGFAEALRAIIKSPLKRGEGALYDNLVGTTRSQLGEEAFAGAWVGGRAMTLEQAVEYALDEQQTD